MIEYASALVMAIIRPSIEYIEAAAKEGAIRMQMLCVMHGPIHHSYFLCIAEAERAAYPTNSTDKTLDKKPLRCSRARLTDEDYPARTPS